jgi:hypothetical protein
MNRLDPMRGASAVYLLVLAFLGLPADARPAGQAPPLEVLLINTAPIVIQFTLFDTSGKSQEFTIGAAKQKVFRNAAKIMICTSGHPCEETLLSLGRRYEIRRHPERKVWYVTESTDWPK